MSEHTTRALRLLRGDVPVYICDYAADFDRLWHLDRPDLWEADVAPQGQNATLKANHAVVVWADTPLDAEVRPVNTEPHVTPVDWAIAARNKHPSLRVTVLDLRNRSDDANYPALRWLRTQRPECLPWLRRLGIPELIDTGQELAGAAVTGKDEAPVKALRALLFDWAPVTSPGTVEADDALEILWRHIRTTGSGHHAIANLVGPLLLLESPPKTGHREALRRVLVAAGRAPEATRRGAPDSTLSDSIFALAPLRIVLVDDQWHHGWAQWVSEFLGLTWGGKAVEEFQASAPAASGDAPGEPQPVAALTDEKGKALKKNGEPLVTLWVTGTVWHDRADRASDAEGRRNRCWLLQRIDDALPADRKADGRFRLRLTKGGGDFTELLLLDLRLFLRRDDKVPSPAEREFAAALLDHAKQFASIDPAWRALTQKELSDIEKWVSGAVPASDSDVEAIVLTLLPRVLALTDLSLPVVLFSSTGRHDIVKKLHGYESVITSFSKPRLLEEVASVAGETGTAFAEALREALALARGRRCIATCLNEQTVGVANEPTYRHATLYLDESAPDNGSALTVGGILALFPDADDEATLDRELKKAGIHWGKGGKPKYKDAENHNPEWCKDISAMAGKGKVRLLALALTASESGSERAVSSRIGTDWTPQHLDRLHRTLIGAAVEVALFHLATGMVRPWTFGVCADVRSRPSSSLQPSVLKELRKKFGIFPGAFSRDGRKWAAVRELVELFSTEKDVLLQRALWSVLGVVSTTRLPADTTLKEAMCRLVEGRIETDARGKPIDNVQSVKRAFEQVLNKHQSVSFIGTDAVLPVVEDILNRYEGSEHLTMFRVTEARGCHLPEGNDGALRPENRSLHYFSDWVAGAVRESRHLTTVRPGWLETLLEQSGGCDEAYDDDLRRRILHARWAMRGDVVRAGAGLIGTGAPLPDASALRKRCARVVADSIVASPGWVFADACRQAMAEQDPVAGEEHAARAAAPSAAAPAPVRATGSLTDPAFGGIEDPSVSAPAPVSPPRSGPRAGTGVAPNPAVPSSRPTKVYVGNLPEDMTGEGLRDLVSHHGTVLGAKVIADWRTGRSRGFGFVTMASIADADAAIGAINGQLVMGMKLVVRRARQRRR